MKLITFCVGLVSVSRAAASSYSSIFTANTGYCTGGIISCNSFYINDCPEYCYGYVATSERCASFSNDPNMSCSVLTASQCMAAAGCTYVNQETANWVIILSAFTIVLCIIMILVCELCERLPDKDKEIDKEYTDSNTQPLLA